MTPTLYILRAEQDDQGTFGRLVGAGFDAHTLEPPDRSNRTGISCIPAGTYRCTIRVSPRFGTVYHLQDVAGRTWILTHWGNLGGDPAKGFRTHTEGCIIIGGSRGTLLVYGRQQKAVLNSHPTFDRFMKHMDGRDFTLKIMEAWS
jgi:hypothetical protein